jgi:hypothetical protein
MLDHYGVDTSTATIVGKPLDAARLVEAVSACVPAAG